MRRVVRSTPRALRPLGWPALLDSRACVPTTLVSAFASADLRLEHPSWTRGLPSPGRPPLPSVCRGPSSMSQGSRGPGFGGHCQSPHSEWVPSPCCSLSPEDSPYDLRSRWLRHDPVSQTVGSQAAGPLCFVPHDAQQSPQHKAQTVAMTGEFVHRQQACSVPPAPGVARAFHSGANSHRG